MYYDYKDSVKPIIIIIIKTSRTGPSVKNKIVYKFSQPHKHLRHGNLKNTTQGSNQRLTAPLNPFNVPVLNGVKFIRPVYGN